MRDYVWGTMPLVTVRLFEGRSLEQKSELAKKLTDAVTASLNVPIDSVEVILDEVPRENWTKAGVQFGVKK